MSPEFPMGYLSAGWRGGKGVEKHGLGFCLEMLSLSRLRASRWKRPGNSGLRQRLPWAGGAGVASCVEWVWAGFGCPERLQLEEIRKYLQAGWGKGDLAG